MIKNILLVDDDDITNFLHKNVLVESQIVENIEVTENASQALDLLKFKKLHGDIFPELIFLDLNMPGLSGWDFIDECKKDKQIPSDSIIIILTTSMNPEDKKKAKNIIEVAEYREKPLTINMVKEIANKYFDPELNIIS